jgi:hypothetical protein
MIINTCLEILSRTFEYIAAQRTAPVPVQQLMPAKKQTSVRVVSEGLDGLRVRMLTAEWC